MTDGTPTGNRRHSTLFIGLGALLGALLTALSMVLIPRCDRDDAPSPPDVAPVTEHTPTASHPSFALPSPSRDMSGHCVLAGQILTEDGTPVEKALVRLRLLDEPWESANVDMVQTTGRDGSYRFDGLTEKAAFQVFAYAKGYRTTDWVGAICGTRTDLMLEKGAVLRLLFVDGQGSPVPFAAVTVAGSALWPARSAMADEQGVLRLPGLSPGFYAFEATSAGQGFSLLEPIELAAGDEVELEARLTPLQPVDVLVKDADTGAPLPDAAVTLHPMNAPLLSRSTVTDADGTARFTAPSVGGSTVSASAPAYIPVTREHITPGDHLQLALSRGASISGIIQTAKGERIADAVVDVRIPEGTATAPVPGGPDRGFLGRKLTAEHRGWPRAIPLSGADMLAGPAHIPLPAMEPDGTERGGPWQPSDAEGRFVIDGLPSGEISLGATHGDFVIHRRPSVTLAPGQRLDGIPILMKRGLELVMRTVSPVGQPVDGAAVTVFDLDGEVVRTADTGRDGYVTIRGLPTEVQLEAAAEGHIPTTRKVFGTSGGTEELTITLPFANRVLTGIVVNRLRTGLPGFTVEAQLTAKNASQMLTAVSGSDGRFEMQGAGEGLYQLRVLLGDEVRARSADVSPGKPVTIVVEDESPLRDETGLPTLSAPAGVTNLAAPPLEEPSGGGGLVLVQPPELPYGSTGMDSLPPASGVPPLSEGGFDSLYVTQPVGIGSLPISLKDKGGAVVVTAVGIGSQVAETGLKAGAILKKVDGAPVSSAAAAKKALSGRIGSVVLIEVLQEDTPLSLVVQRVP